MPPALTVADTDSLGERIQRAFPDARVVTSLSTVLADLMVEPSRLPGPHSIFVAGDDTDAKATVRGLLEASGWPAAEIIDLGSITAARGAEMYAGLSFALFGALGTFEFNIAVIHRAGAEA
ncbi:hypothetical protein [Brachybacterium kimchii]|uniref:NADP oxidoreductase n=1 Tax=Brachybacterium kimchii TaxID=2942909 RepID=A0ABY4N8M1_9MICO|nr:hypothetical protein [Brachybacterium kimchii]UQN30902.1 hypothetical protein M4486_06295 [Brachybacterium kimchii]